MTFMIRQTNGRRSCFNVNLDSEHKSQSEVLDLNTSSASNSRHKAIDNDKSREKRETENHADSNNKFNTVRNTTKSRRSSQYSDKHNNKNNNIGKNIQQNESNSKKSQSSKKFINQNCENTSRNLEECVAS